MNNLHLNNITKNNIKKISHNSKIYYEYIEKSRIDYNDKIYFETNPLVCNKCNITFDIYKKIYIYYLFFIKKNININIYFKVLKKLKLFHNIKCENNLIGAQTYWYIHLCHKCI